MERRVAVIVSSDSGYEGKREDQSGPEICRIAEEHGYRVVSFVILPDDQEKLFDEILRRHIRSCSTEQLERLKAPANELREAREFADRYGIATAHEGYDALVNDPTVDVVYVNTTHNLHAEHALLAIEAGKPVLVEKAFTVTAAEARRVAEAAGLQACSRWRRCGRGFCRPPTSCASASPTGHWARCAR